MKVVIDISPLKSGHKTRGIGVYTRRLIEALRQVDKKNKYLLTTQSEQITGANLIHYPYFDLFFHTLPIKKKTKNVVTIHDVIPLLFPKDFPIGIKGKVHYQLQRLALKNVDAVITDSENSKRDIIKYLSVPENQIHVIYLAASKDFKPQPLSLIKRVKTRYNLPEKYLLYVGDVNPNKNLHRLLEAFALVTKKSQDVYLVMVGKSFGENIKEVEKLQETINKFNLNEKVIILTKVPLDPYRDLISIYAGALVYIQPSLYEGFGLPLLEALACGTPVIAGNTSSVPEITQGAAILVDPKSVENISQAILQFLKLKENSRDEIIKRGLCQVKKFSWEKTANDTIKVYKKVISNAKIDNR